MTFHDWAWRHTCGAINLGRPPARGRDLACQDCQELVTEADQVAAIYALVDVSDFRTLLSLAEWLAANT